MSGRKRKRPDVGLPVMSGRARKKVSAKTVEKAVERYMRKETTLKGADVPISYVEALATFTTNGGMYNLTNLIHGDKNFERKDVKIVGKSLRLKLAMLHRHKEELVTGNFKGGLLRVSVVLDKEPKRTAAGALPQFQDIFQNLDTAGSATTGIFANLTYGETTRFKVLRDHIFNFSPKIAPIDRSLTEHEAQNWQYLDWFIDLKDLEQIWEPNSSNQVKNRIILVVRASAADAHNKFSFYGNARFRYTDM